VIHSKHGISNACNPLKSQDHLTSNRHAIANEEGKKTKWSRLQLDN